MTSPISNKTSRRTVYPGVDAHANSWMLHQKQGIWHSFHEMFIQYLRKEISRKLPPNYEARTDISTGIIETEPPKSKQPETTRPKSAKRYDPIPDVAVYQHTPPLSPASQSSARQAPPLVLDTIDALNLDETLDYTSIGIYKLSTDDVFGTLVTRVEVISPSNKPAPPGTWRAELEGLSGFRTYERVRQRTLASAVNLCEFDIIHTQPSIIPSLRGYPDVEDTYLYSTALIRPIPSIEKGRTDIYQFRVGQAFPIVDLPLKGTDLAPNIDLNEPYYLALTDMELGRFINYATYPEHFELYSALDQRQIEARINVIHSINDRGKPLTGTWPPEWPLEIDLEKLITALLETGSRNAER